MKPAPFKYHRPATMDEALNILAEHGSQAKVIAGGQSLAPMMNMRVANPEHLVDINDLSEFNFIRSDDGAIFVGPLARHYQVAQSPLVNSVCPLLAYSASTIGHYVIRQRGTLAGSLAHADPAAQIPLVAITLGAKISLLSLKGVREIEANDFFIGPMTTDIGDGEIISKVAFPVVGDRAGWAFEIFNRRHGDYAIVSIAVHLSLDALGRIGVFEIGISGLGGLPLSLTSQMREVATGITPDDAGVEHLVLGIDRLILPEEGQHISSEYKRELCSALAREAIRKAARRAQECDGK